MKNMMDRLNWAMKILSMYFSETEFSHEGQGCLVFSTRVCSRTLKLILFDMNKAMKELAINVVFESGELIPEKPTYSEYHVIVRWVEIWDEIIHDVNPFTMNCIVRQSIKGHMPYDDLSKIHLFGQDVDTLRYSTSDGLGFTASNIEASFKVEAIDYTGCDGNPDDPDWEYYEVPCLWCYTGKIKGYKFQGIASTSGLAIGKTMRAMYKFAKVNDPETAAIIEENKANWRTYGYCY